MNFKNIYNNELYERYTHPKHKVTLLEPTASSGIYNPSCGDKVQIQLIIKEGVIAKIGHETQGCVISAGAADLICDYVAQQPVEILRTLTREKIFEIIGMELGPNRLRCAFITVEALQNALQNYINNLTVSP